MSNSTTKKSRSKNHTGHTYKMKNGRYRTVVMYKGKTITAVGSTEKESQRLAQGKLKNLPQAVEKLSKDALTLKLIDYMPEWLHGKHVKKVAPTTYKRYVGLMEKWILPSLGHIKVVELNKHHVNALMEYMDGKVGPRSQQQARALLSATFAHLVKREWIQNNPVLNSDEIEYQKKEINPLTLSEVQALMNYSKGTSLHARLILACFYGLRQGEALGLRWSSIDFEARQLKIHEQLQTIKGKRQFVPLKSSASNRKLEIDTGTLEVLRAYKKMQSEQRLLLGPKWQDNDLVFPTSVGLPMNPKVDYKNWQQALAACGIGKHRLHDARHTAATLLFDKGLDVELIRRFLGNSSVELTAKTYVHHSTSQFENTAQIIGRMAL